MLVLLSPAKDLALETPVIKGTTQPALLDDARRLVTKLKTLSAKKLADLMDLSLKLGELNKERYTRWHVPFTVKNARPAVFTFNGEVYRGLDARTLNDGDLRFAQHHLRILSGLYGVLRPLDLMQDYRLIMGTPFGMGKAKNLYAFWGGRITDVLNTDLKEAKSNAVINCASGEYFKAVDPKRLKARVITPVFKDRSGNTYKSLQVYVKQQRGAMARYIIQHRLLDPEGIKSFDSNGYRFSPEHSSENEWVFLRDKRPPLVPQKLKGGRIR
ncbi:MAG TPA: peroxide stress protein YaaA [Flavobacteriales bacterium]|nr:peroxide stress protein YaaA [Flavobacteriales bacterium]HNU57800.1 peroxide stress protein YaaA [Flavobacteriales bacterium]